MEETAFDRVTKHLNEHGPDVPYKGDRRDLIEVQERTNDTNGVELSPYLISLLRLEGLI